MHLISPTFALFLPVVFVVYWGAGKLLKGATPQNVVLIVVSYVFYGLWDVRLACLLVGVSLTGYVAGLALERATRARTRKAILVLTLVVALGVLGYFKYADFFLGSMTTLLNDLGLGAPTYALRILLPLGISFYTFQMLTYPLDIYRRQMHATADVIAYFAFTSFFAQLDSRPDRQSQGDAAAIPDSAHLR